MMPPTLVQGSSLPFHQSPKSESPGRRILAVPVLLWCAWLLAVHYMKLSVLLEAVRPDAGMEIFCSRSSLSQQLLCHQHLDLRVRPIGHEKWGRQDEGWEREASALVT